MELFRKIFSALAPSNAANAIEEGPKLEGSVGWIFKAWGSNGQATWNIEIKKPIESAENDTEFLDKNLLEAGLEKSQETPLGKEKDSAPNLEVVRPKVIGWGRRGERTPRIEVVSAPRLNKVMPKEKFIQVVKKNSKATDTEFGTPKLGTVKDKEEGVEIREPKSQ